MAIPFGRLTPVHITEKSDATRVVAYVTRAAIPSPRGRTYDYTHLNNDLAYESVILTEETPPSFLGSGTLVTALDEAELRKIRTPIRDRKRPPQVALAITIALPPETEVTLPEAAEILRRIVLLARGSVPVPILIAIHVVLLNRHGHAVYGLRPIDSRGQLGLKVRDFIVHHRVRDITDGAEIVEGIDWPSLTWEVQQTYFLERGLDLVVDPIALVPGTHHEPYVYANGEFHDPDTKLRLSELRQLTRNHNIRAIKGSSTHLVETLLRRRSKLQIAELHRLCTRFFDNDWQRQAEVDRIVSDQNIVGSTSSDGESEPRYVTTRRIARLVVRAARLIDSPARELQAITGPDHDTVVTQIAEFCAVEGHQYDQPLILGRSLSDCRAIAGALADRLPLVGTIDMAVTGPSRMRATGRTRGICLQSGRAVIVPHAERIDDQRMARLVLAAHQIGVKLLLGHDQSYKSGIVCRHLASYATDTTAVKQGADGETGKPDTIERMLRAGLVRHAVEAMADCKLLNFGLLEDRPLDTTPGFVICDDPQRIRGTGDAIRQKRLSAGLSERPQVLSGLRGNSAFSIAEWIVTTSKQGLPRRLTAHQLAQIVEINSSDNTITVMRHAERHQLDFTIDPAIQPAAAISIRAAWDAPPEARAVIELSNRCRTWSALVLAAARFPHAKLHIDPAVARSVAELVAATRHALPASVPHQKLVAADQDVVLRKQRYVFDHFPESAAAKLPPAPEPVGFTSNPDVVLDNQNYVFDPFPTSVDAELLRPPAPIGFAEEVRHRLSKNAHTRLAYQLLHRHVERQNPQNAKNLARILGLCRNELTKAVARFLAQVEFPRMTVDELREFDLPFELHELEPRNWTERDLHEFERELHEMSVRAYGWGMLPPVASGSSQ